MIVVDCINRLGVSKLFKTVCVKPTGKLLRVIQEVITGSAHAC